MEIGLPPITWDLKYIGEPWVYIGTPLPNPSGNTGVMDVCILMQFSSIDKMIPEEGTSREDT